jgi:hypothetical protein
MEIVEKLFFDYTMPENLEVQPPFKSLSTGTRMMLSNLFSWWGEANQSK